MDSNKIPLYEPLIWRRSYEVNKIPLYEPLIWRRSYEVNNNDEEERKKWDWTVIKAESGWWTPCVPMQPDHIEWAMLMTVDESDVQEWNYHIIPERGINIIKLREMIGRYKWMFNSPIGQYIKHTTHFIMPRR